MKKHFKRFLAALLAILMVMGAFPISSFATPASDIPKQMYNNVYLDALAYTGYKVQKQIDDGSIFIKYAWNGASSYLSGIGYDSSFIVNGTETVSDSSTVSGKAPNIARFKETGLCCASYVSYVYFNYLPNIKGYDMSAWAKPSNYKSASSYHDAAEKWVSAGLAKKISYTQSSDGKTFTPKEDIPIGSLIVFKDTSGTYSHVALYAGYYNGKHFVTHTGNSRGPEIHCIEEMEKNGGMELVANIYTPPHDDGEIRIYKKDPNGNNLSGAEFEATNNSTGKKYTIGPTNSSGYARLEDVPYGTYTVKETKFPKNYQSSGQTSWTVTVSSANDGIVTINAINEKIPKYCNVSVTKKSSLTGEVLGGASFKVQQYNVSSKTWSDYKTLTASTSNGSTKYTATNLLVSDDNGGWFRIVETKAPSGYTNDPKYSSSDSNTYTDGRFRFLYDDDTDGKTFNFTVKNDPQTGDLEVTKNAEDNKVEGIKFHLYGTSTLGIKVDKYATTNSKGIATFSDIYVGTYTLEEVETAERYEVPPSQKATIEWDKVTKKTFDNDLKRGDLEVIKTSEDGIVKGMRFHLYGTSLSGIKVDDYAVTDSKGVARFTDILIGTNYTIEEVDTPIRYIVPASQKTAVEWDKVTTVKFENILKRGDLKVVKTVEDGYLSGKKFRLTGTSLSGEKIDMYATTNAQGIAWFRDVLIGTYKIEEVETPEQYIVPASQTAEIEWNKVTTVEFDNVLKRGDLKVIKTSEDNLVEGVRFHLTGTSLSGAAINEYATTNAQGVAIFKDILIGTGYVISEMDVPEKYIVPANQTAAIEWKKVPEVKFHNVLKRGDLTVTKTSEDGLVEGLKFHLYGNSIADIYVDEYATTNADGVATFKDILIGRNYVIEEVNTPIRYVIPSSQTAPIEWKKVTNRHFENILKKFRVQVTKSDSEKGLPQGDATLAGAVYGIYKDGELIDTYTTDIKGQFTTKYYICGENWTIKEISPSEGYLLDKTVHKIASEPKLYTVEFNTTSNDVAEDVIKGSIAIIKHSDDGSTQVETPEVGAEFEVYLKSAGSYAKAKATERDILVCDEFGFAQTKELPYGVYTLHQTKGWDGREKIDDFDVFISKDGYVYRLIINNAYFESYIKIVKTDAETGKAIPYAGAAFQIYAPDGTLIKQTFTYPTPTTIDTFYTNSEGYLVTPEKLPFGSGYRLVEVQAPYGYVLDSTPIIFDVKQEDSTKENELTIITINRPNMPQKGIIEISKSGEVFASVTESNDIYSPIYTDKALANAVFEIYAFEDIITPEGTVRYTKGQLVDTITTGKNGVAESKQLYLGKYIVKEKTAPNTFVLNQNEFIVELTYAGQNVKVTSTALSVYDDRQKVSVSLSKILENDDAYKIGMNGEIISVQFGIFAAEDIKAADGSIIPKGGLVAIANCDENGTITFDCDLPIGFKWYAKEMDVDNHYFLSDAMYEFSTEYRDQTISVYEIKINNGEAIENTLKRGTIKGIKVGEEQEALAGALIGIFAPGTIEFTEENAIATVVSAEDGSFAFENVPYGEWIVKEIAPPESYVLDATQHHVYITDDGVTINIRIDNTHIYGNVKIKKVDSITGKTIPGVGFRIYDKDMNIVAEGYTDKNGRCYFEHLVYGDYFYQEFYCDESYVIDETPYPFSITEDGVTVKLEMTNRKKQGNLEISKTDVSSGEVLPNVGFRIYDEDGNIIAEGYTDENGVATFENLIYGDYFYQEFSCSDEYVLDDSLYPFSIREDGVTVKAEMTNRQKVGNLEITKTDVATADVLPNVGFRIYDEDGNIIAEGYTDENGQFTVENLTYGDYFYQEFSCSDKYVLDDSLYPFSIGEDGVTVKAEMTNRKKAGNLEITKSDVSSGELLPNVGFRIYDEDGNIIAEGYTDENGVATFENLIYGNYFYQEFSCDESYILDDTLYPFSITEDGVTVKAEMTNRQKTGKLIITKVDASDKKTVLAGVVFVIEDENGNVVAELTTNKKGIAEIELPYGKYILYEKSTVSGYVLDDTRYEIEITEDGQIIKITVENSRVPEDTPKDDTPNIETPYTGDNRNYGVVIGLCMIAIGAAISAAILKTKSKKDEDED